MQISDLFKIGVKTQNVFLWTSIPFIISYTDATRHALITVDHINGRIGFSEEDHYEWMALRYFN